MKKILLLSLFVASSSTLFACSDDDDEPEGEAATAQFYAYGEPFIEDGIPAEEFEDGWAVTFDEFIVTLSEVGVEDAGGWTEAGATSLYIDVAEASSDASNPGHDAGSAALTTAEDYDTAFYTIAPNSTGNSVNADSASVTAMQSAGASVLVRGTATKGEDTLNFDWIFTSDKTYRPCEIEDFTPQAAENVRVELTIHGDHLFYDSLSSEEPGLVFQPFADADANSDGTITTAELEAVDIASTSLSFSGFDNIETLLDYSEAQSATLGHINGEGHCD